MATVNNLNTSSITNNNIIGTAAAASPSIYPSSIIGKLNESNNHFHGGALLSLPTPVEWDLVKLEDNNLKKCEEEEEGGDECAPPV